MYPLVTPYRIGGKPTEVVHLPGLAAATIAAPPDFAWSAPPAELVLAAGDVHLWRAPLVADEIQLAQFRETLCAGERDRASRFHFAKGQREFIAARAILRILLGRYTGQPPDRLRFGYGAKGKPFLDERQSEPSVRFNLSHSDGLALYAFSRGREVGVDVECVRPSFSDDRIAEQFFSAREAAAIRALPAHRRPHSFLALWTAKEAWLKAKGAGLGDPWEEFEVSLRPPGDPVLTRRAGPSQPEQQWSFRSFPPAPGYMGALVVQGTGATLHCWDWPESAPQ